MKQTIRVPVAEIMSDIDQGLSDAELMEKYGLSENGLQRLFERLLRAMATGANQIRIESDRSEPR